MNCPKCRAELEKNWEYCPRCGMILKNNVFKLRFNFGEIFKRLTKEMEHMNKSFEKDVGVYDLTPAFGKPRKKASGFTIRIARAGSNEPRVSVQTFGDVDRNAVKHEVEELADGIGVKMKKPPQTEEKDLPLPKQTEEPKTEVRKLDSKVIVDIEIPGVRSEDDIRVKELENSVEVKAVAGDKAYFKILTKPGQFRITKKDFREGKLVIEFS